MVDSKQRYASVIKSTIALPVVLQITMISLLTSCGHFKTSVLNLAVFVLLEVKVHRNESSFEYCRQLWLFGAVCTCQSSR